MSAKILVCIVPFLNFIFSKCFNIPTNRLWTPCPGIQVHFFSSTDCHHWHSNTPMKSPHPWFPIKTLAQGSSPSLCSPPTWLSLNGGHSSPSRTCEHNNFSFPMPQQVYCLQPCWIDFSRCYKIYNPIYNLLSISKNLDHPSFFSQCHIPYIIHQQRKPTYTFSPFLL